MSITNFLKGGALLRHKEQWVLIEGPFTPTPQSHSGEITTFCPDFYDVASTRPLFGAKVTRLAPQQLQKLCEEYLLQVPPEEPPLQRAPWVEPPKEDFERSFTQIQNHIQKGTIKKAVPAVFASSKQSVKPADLLQMLLNLLKAPQSLYVYGFWQDGEGILGATPEILFEYENSTLRTMALAGTCPKSEVLHRTPLTDDPKELFEHQLVVEDLKQVLSPLGPVKSEGPMVVELPTLFHLKTNLEIRCATRPHFLELIKQMHPTPALGVAPRSAGYQWMKELPGQTGRKGFGAPFAFLEEEKVLCLVAIRNLQWTKDCAMIGSGCGIVAASEVEQEWRELQQKRDSVKKILGL